LPKCAAIDCAKSPDESLIIERAHLVEQDQPDFSRQTEPESGRAQAGCPSSSAQL